MPITRVDRPLVVGIASVSRSGHLADRKVDERHEAIAVTLFDQASEFIQCEVGDRPGEGPTMGMQAFRGCDGVERVGLSGGRILSTALQIP